MAFFFCKDTQEEVRCVIIKKFRQKKIVCNKCKKEITIKNGIPEEEMLTVEKRWGYFSHKDGELHRFDICEECYDTWIASFQIPVYGEQELEC